MATSNTMINLPLSGSGVTSLNSLTGAITLAAGTNITLTPVGNTITIAASGGGGTPGGSNTQIQYNNSSAFGGDANFTTNGSGLVALTTPGIAITIPTNQGIFNQNTTASTNAVKNQYSPAHYFIGHSWRSTGSLDYTAQMRTYLSTIDNVNSPPVSRLNIEQLTSTTGTGTWTSIGYFYALAGGGIVLQTGLTLNGSFSANQVVTNALAVNGTASFGGGVNFLNNVTFFNQISASAATFSGNVQVLGNFNLTANGGTIHGNSGSFTNDLTCSTFIADAPSVTVNPASNLLMNLVLAQASADATGPVATQNTPHLQRPDSFLATPNYAELGFTANGNTYDYIIYSENGSNQYSVVSSSSSFTDDNSSNPFGVDLTWNAPSSLDTIVNYLVGRQINGGGYLYQLVGNVTNFTDTNSDPFSDSAPGTFTSDYTANGTTRNYQIAGHNLSPSLHDYFSVTQPTYNVADDNSGNAYTVLHTWAGNNDARILGDPSGTPSQQVDVSGGSYTEDSNSWTGSAVLSPTTYGIFSDGSALSISFDLYGIQTIGTATIYSSSPASTTTTDPNDAQSYYLSYTFDPGLDNTSAKMLVSNSFPFSAIIPGNPGFLDALSTSATNTTITPTSTSQESGIFINTAASSADNANVALKSAAADYTRLDFLNNLNVKTSSIESSTSGMKISTAGFGIFGASPAVQQTGGAATAGATYTSTEQDMINRMYVALQAYGLIS